jgi:hypothetical protein
MRQPWSSAQPSLVDLPALCVSECQRVKERAEGELWGEGGVTVGSSASPHQLRQVEAHGIHAGHTLAHGRHAQSTRWPLWHFTEHVVATKWPAWDVILGSLWADLDIGQKRKFVHHQILSNFD